MKQAAAVALTCLLALSAATRIAAEPAKEAFFEIAINDESIGYLNFMLRPDVVPKTVENFTNLLPRYVGTFFHRIIPGFMAQGGDVEKNILPDANTTRVQSFNDENFDLKHSSAGILSMANAGPNTNSSQFFITTVPTPWLDEHHVVFGKITESSMEVLKRIEATGSVSGRPSAKVTIKNAGIGHKTNTN